MFFRISQRGLLRLMVLFLMIGNCAAQAQSLVSIKTETVASLPGGDKILHILAIEGVAVALGGKYIWTLTDGASSWKPTGWKPQRQIRGVISDSERAFLLTGSTLGGPISHVTEFHLPDTQETMNKVQIPPLPVPLTTARGAILLGRIFVVGRGLNNMPQMVSLDPLATPLRWVSHAPPPLLSAAVTSIVAQNSLLLVTASDHNGGGDRLLYWRRADGWQERPRVAGNVVPGSARPIGQGHALYMIKTLPESGAKPELVSYNTVTGGWAIYGAVEAAGAEFVTGWKNGLLWGRQDINDGHTVFAAAGIESGKQLLHNADWFIIGIYLLSMLGIGLYFYRRHAQDSKSDFFLGGRSIPFWAAGISLYASNASSISYIAVPAKAFATNWQYLMSNLIVVVGLMFVAIWIVPLIRRLNLMSSFQYLEIRFHPGIRILSSALFIVFQLGGRMTIILFLPSLAISTVTGMDMTFSILIMGGITIVYTVLGGMKAVIWTDVMQLFVMFGGTIFAITFVMLMLDGGVGEFFSTSLAQGKMKMLDWSFNLTEATVWGFIFLIIFDTILTFPKDQVLMQRVLSTETAKDAGRSVWTFALIVIPGSVMFYVVGTALYVFYQNHPERMDPTMSMDAIFPLFIAAELPVGVTGLIIAGIFAASMSTLSSILNSVATVATVDFYEKIIQNSSERKTVRFAEIITVISGLIGIGFALLLSRFEINSLLDLALELWGLLGGGFAGAYTLGMFTRRSNWQGVSIGVAISIAITLAAWTVNLVHPYFYLPFSVMICIIVGYGASWFFPAPRDLDGLTIYEEDIIK